MEPGKAHLGPLPDARRSTRSGPRLLVIGGAPKSGTTSLSTALARSGRFDLSSVKEPRHYCQFDRGAFTGPLSDGFNDTWCKSRTDYEATFAPPTSDVVRLDASTDYLSNPGAFERLKTGSPDSFLMLVLREPASRAFSEYLHTLRDAGLTETFTESLERERARRDRGWPPLFWHRRRSAYADGLEEAIDVFGRKSLMIVPHTAVRTSSQAVLAELGTMLDVDTLGLRVGVNNRSDMPRSRFVHELLHSRRTRRSAANQRAVDLAKCVPGMKSVARAITVINGQLPRTMSQRDSDVYYSERRTREDLERSLRVLDRFCGRPWVF